MSTARSCAARWVGIESSYEKQPDKNTQWLSSVQRKIRAWRSVRHALSFRLWAATAGDGGFML